MRVDLGKSYSINKINIVLDTNDKYYYIIQGTNDPTLTDWDELVDRKLFGKKTNDRAIQESLKGDYSYIKITFYKLNSTLGIKEIEIY